MKISLVYTTNELNPNFSDLKFRDENMGIITPLSLIAVASILEKEGVAVQILDVDAERLRYEQILRRLAEFAPDLLGFTVTTHSFQPVLRWIKKLKQDTGLPVLIGGAHTALYPAEIMTHKEIDYMILGEAEIPLPEFIRAFERRNQDYEQIKAFAYRRNGQVLINKELQMVRDLDTIPYPARHLLKNELYAEFLTRKRNFTVMLSSRGCPYRCAFCDQKRTPYRGRSARSLVAEMKYNYEKFGIREFDMYDSTFTADRNRLIEICRLIQEEKLNLRWTIRSRVDSVNEKMLDALKSAGCHTIFYGIESSNPEILKRMKKGITLEQVRRILKYTKSIGIDMMGYFMLGFPGETRKTIEDTIRFSLDLPLDYAQFTVLTPITGTEIYDYYRERGMKDYWAEYTLGPDKKYETIELIETELDRDETNQYVGRAYRRFYFRPRIIFKQIKLLSSYRKLISLVRGAIGMLKS
ncbi:MAG: radical SAM protein [Candidatus Vogelbacteria bacterium]|nr:radical SAM protein [Candidatus Vogelbacteria bacterium]